MNIEELIIKHSEIQNTVDYTSDKEHVRLSIVFAVSILEEIADDESELDTIDLVWTKLMMLRQQINN